MLIANPSTDKEQGCRSFTLKCKCELLMMIERSPAFSFSLELASYLASKADTIANKKKKLDTVPNHTSSNMRKVHTGHPDLLAPLNDLLLRYVFELCEQGMVVTTRIVLRRAPDLCRIFCAKLDCAKSLIVHWWLKAKGLRYQMGTNEFQRSPAEEASDTLNFMLEKRKKVRETNHEKNMLSIKIKPIFFTSHSKQALEMRGVKTVAICNSTQDTR